MPPKSSHAGPLVFALIAYELAAPGVAVAPGPAVQSLGLGYFIEPSGRGCLERWESCTCLEAFFALKSSPPERIFIVFPGVSAAGGAYEDHAASLRSQGEGSL